MNISFYFPFFIKLLPLLLVETLLSLSLSLSAGLPSSEVSADVTCRGKGPAQQSKIFRFHFQLCKENLDV